MKLCIFLASSDFCALHCTRWAGFAFQGEFLTLHGMVPLSQCSQVCVRLCPSSLQDWVLPLRGELGTDMVNRPLGPRTHPQPPAVLVDSVCQGRAVS